VPVSIRVFLVDDHEVVRRGLRELLNAEDDIEVVGEAATAGMAVAASRKPTLMWLCLTFACQMATGLKRAGTCVPATLNLPA
jgi:DNA-binding NarL/FixJ family response regulator